MKEIKACCIARMPDQTVLVLLLIANTRISEITSHWPPCSSFKQQFGRPDMQGMWKDGLSRLAKLEASIRSRLPIGWPQNILQQYVTRLGKIVQSCWDSG